MTRTVWKYALLQIPELALLFVFLLLLRDWAELPPWVFWMVLALWLVKDALLYPVYRRALAGSVPTDVVIGALGIALEPIAPTGYIRVRGEYWKARLREGTPPVGEGKKVRVEKMEGLTLEVVGEESEE